MDDGTNIELPTTKQGVTKLLRDCGHAGLQVESFEQPQLCLCDDGAIEMRAYVYCLTAPVLHENNEMKRKALTILFRYVDEKVAVRRLEGWVVPKPWIAAA